jgi:hypothetical protein
MNTGVSARVQMRVQRLVGSEVDMLDFLGIGAQKAGTTWIYQHLSRHPDIRFPAGKEVHFWGRCGSNGAEWWTGLFAEDHQRQKQGEITPAYATLDEATIREIAALAPNLRVFYSLQSDSTGMVVGADGS